MKLIPKGVFRLLRPVKTRSSFTVQPVPSSENVHVKPSDIIPKLVAISIGDQENTSHLTFRSVKEPFHLEIISDKTCSTSHEDFTTVLMRM